MLRTLKAWLLILGLCMCTGAFAQSHSFRFFPVDSISFANHGFIGNVDNQFFLLNRRSRKSLNLTIYDTITRTKKDYVYPVVMDIVSIIVNEHSVSFVGVLNKSADKLTYYFMEIDGEGKILRKNEGTMSVLYTPLLSVTSKDKKHVLFYQYARRNNDSIYVQGSMLGAEGQFEKELMYTFKADAERTTSPETFIDNKGNTHIIVYDRFTNYRISTDLSINTIPFTDDEMVSETFTLEKMKLKTLRVFENDSKKCIQVQGLYANGPDRITRGVYSIDLPITRSSQLRPRFSPFSSEMIKAFRKGYPATELTIRNSLQLRDWFYSENGSIVMLSLSTAARPEIDVRDANWYRPAFGALGPNVPMVLTESKAWNAPKQIFIKMGKEQGIEWHIVQKLDVFRVAGMNYNNILLMRGDEEKPLMLLYQADKEEQPHPTVVSFKDGKPVSERLPERELAFSPVQYLHNNQYGSLYMNLDTGEAGILLINSHP